MSIAIGIAAVFLIIMFTVTRKPALRVLSVIVTATAFTVFAAAPTVVANATGTPTTPTVTATATTTGTAVTILGVNVNTTTEALSTLDGWTDKNDANLKAFGDLFGTETEKTIRALMDTLGSTVGKVSDVAGNILDNAKLPLG